MRYEWFNNFWTIKHIRNEKVIWEQTKHNDLTNSGERSILNSYFCNVENPTTFYVRLCRNFIGKTDTLASLIGEPVGNGYSPQEVERSKVGFPTTELLGADYRLVSKTVSFTATGQWNPVNYMILATSSDNSGVLISGVVLENERTLSSGDVLQIQFKILLR